MIKKEVTWDDLNEALADKTLNLDHEFVQYILHKPRQSLCIFMKLLQLPVMQILIQMH